MPKGEGMNRGTQLAFKVTKTLVEEVDSPEDMIQALMSCAVAIYNGSPTSEAKTAVAGGILALQFSIKENEGNND
jgi:hypothetical protein